MPSQASQMFLKEGPSRQPEKVKQMVALSVSCSEVVEHDEKGEAQRVVSRKDMELRGVSMATQTNSTLEDTILEYVKKRNGEIDPRQCADQLNVPPDRVLKALEELGARKKIQIQR